MLLKAAEHASETLKIAVAMSGGVDSSVTAALLARQGHEVTGLTMRLYDSAIEVVKTGTCCAGKDIRDAAEVSKRIGIRHEVVGYEDTFERDVIQPFADAYAAGETPIPCVACNATVKFRDLIQAARDLGCDALATGHYARRIIGADGRAELWRGVDHRRDQSYFLYRTTREQLDFLRFPLGEMAGKDETRAIAESLGLSVAAKPDSQDICFVPHGDYAKVVKSYRRDAVRPGEIVDVDGHVLGDHDGLIWFTVGQRRGLGIGGTERPLYVVRLEPETNRVIVGPREALATATVHVRDVNWLGDGDAIPAEGVRCAVKLRSLHDPVEATVHPEPDGRARVELATPFEAAAPGQACVFFAEDRVLGGGWITRG